jgi:hypothetical protein
VYLMRDIIYERYNLAGQALSVREKRYNYSEV